MRTHLKMAVLLSVTVSVLSAVPALAQNVEGETPVLRKEDKLEFCEVSLSARKEHLILGEPLLLRVKIKDISGRIGSWEQHSSYAVTVPDGSKVRVEAVPKRASVRRKLLDFAAGEERTVRTTLIFNPSLDRETDLLFSKPGKYVLEVRMTAGVFLNKLEFWVEEPATDEDKAAYKLIEANAAEKGAASYARHMDQGGYVPIFDEIATKFPNSTYAPYCRFFAARGRCYGGCGLVEPLWHPLYGEPVPKEKDDPRWAEMIAQIKAYEDFFTDIATNDPGHEYAGEAAFVVYQITLEKMFEKYLGEYRRIMDEGADYAAGKYPVQEIEELHARAAAEKESVCAWLTAFEADHPESGASDICYLFQDEKESRLKVIDGELEHTAQLVESWKQKAGE